MLILRYSYDKWKTSEANAEGYKMAMWCLL